MVQRVLFPYFTALLQKQYFQKRLEINLTAPDKPVLETW